MTYLAFLESLLADAGRTVMTLPRRMSVRIKDADANQVVTAADIAIGNQLKSRIHQEYPDDSIIDEESDAVHGKSPITWIIDPIDGTSNFTAGSLLFGIMVGILKDGKPVAAWSGASCTRRNVRGRGWAGSLLQRRQAGDKRRRRFVRGVAGLRNRHPSGRDRSGLSNTRRPRIPQQGNPHEQLHI